jgi:O-antigen biosynthesis protein WbqP
VIRLLDVCLAALGLVLLAPLLLLLACVGWLDSGSPFFRQRRLGQNAQPFWLIKLRTMRPGTAQLATHLVDKHAVTRWGSLLRRSKLDELPQLWNVLIGDMSLVGPRPCLPSQQEIITARERLGVFALRPGITGPAQVQGVDMSQPARLAVLDASLLQQFTLGRYFWLLWVTLCGRGMGDQVRK